MFWHSGKALLVCLKHQYSEVVLFLGMCRQLWVPWHNLSINIYLNLTDSFYPRNKLFCQQAYEVCAGGRSSQCLLNCLRKLHALHNYNGILNHYHKSVYTRCGNVIYISFRPTLPRGQSLFSASGHSTEQRVRMCFFPSILSACRR